MFVSEFNVVIYPWWVCAQCKSLKHGSMDTVPIDRERRSWSRWCIKFDSLLDIWTSTVRCNLYSCVSVDKTFSVCQEVFVSLVGEILCPCLTTKKLWLVPCHWLNTQICSLKSWCVSHRNILNRPSFLCCVLDRQNLCP